MNTYDLWFERRLNLPGLNLQPVEYLEEEVVLNLLLALLHATHNEYKTKQIVSFLYIQYFHISDNLLMESFN